MTKKQIALELAKQIATHAKKDYPMEATNSIKDLAERMKINVEKQIMPLARYLVVTYDNSLDIENFTMEEAKQLEGSTF